VGVPVFGLTDQGDGIAGLVGNLDTIDNREIFSGRDGATPFQGACKARAKGVSGKPLAVTA